MSKIFKFSFLVCFLSSFLLSNDDTYVIEAKGEFAKELKDLAQKYSKDENSDIVIYKKSSNLENDPSKSIKSSLQEGKKLYEKKCIDCHGENGTKRSYAGVRKLSQMSAEEIYYTFRKYYSDPSHGGAGRISMQPISGSTTSDELRYIIAYLKGESEFLPGKKDKMQNTNISRNPTNQGTYLK